MDLLTWPVLLRLSGRSSYRKTGQTAFPSRARASVVINSASCGYVNRVVLDTVKDRMRFVEESNVRNNGGSIPFVSGVSLGVAGFREILLRMGYENTSTPQL